MGSRNCCYQCEKRTAECHATCQEYAEYAKKAEELRTQRYQTLFNSNQLRSVKRDHCEKNRRKHKS